MTMRDVAFMIDGAGFGFLLCWVLGIWTGRMRW